MQQRGNFAKAVQRILVKHGLDCVLLLRLEWEVQIAADQVLDEDLDVDFELVELLDVLEALPQHVADHLAVVVGVLQDADALEAQNPALNSIYIGFDFGLVIIWFWFGFCF